ncbi:kinase-like domain-containing protein [Rhizophagus diaphanus]|nr:kinase-like domain-containing protein [Rhizophagus diaphanus] [Rhizophagus sp. MUCL 43196]
MSSIRYELVYATTSRAVSLIDYNIYTDMHKRYEFQKRTILTDKLLTDNEKALAIKQITETYDRNKILLNSGTKRICETCKQECLATLYCEYCVRNYLKANFSNWTSGNDDINNLIQKCQMECLGPDNIVEWIPYNNFKNIKYLTKGGFSEIYTADWINGNYREWDSEKQQLRRFGTIEIVLKKLENVKSANQSWFEEAKSHLTISAKLPIIARCYGLTQDISDGNYMLVIMKMNMDLRKYLQQNYNQLIWKEKIRIVYEIIEAIYWIHKENAIHRDLHSGNILFSQFNDSWYISDLGFCGPADKSTKSIYGNLPYIAPEIISGKGYTFASDIYSIAILIPEIDSEIPLEYKNLMEQCWDADPSKRPNIGILVDKIGEIHLLYQNKPNELFQSKAKNNSETKTNSNYTNSSRVFTSKIHQFGNLPEPKNATEGEQEGFHIKTYDFSIPDNVDDFNNSSNKKTSKINSYFKASSKRLSKVFKKLHINSKHDIQNDNKKETIQQQIKGPINDEKVYNSPNLHSEEQDELEIPDEIPSVKLN